MELLPDKGGSGALQQYGFNFEFVAATQKTYEVRPRLSVQVLDGKCECLFFTLHLAPLPQPLEYQFLGVYVFIAQLQMKEVFILVELVVSRKMQESA